MNILNTPLQDVYIIESEEHIDERGSFSRTFDKHTLFSKSINFNIIQSSISHNDKKGTLRGLHYQDHPFLESKIVSCIKGAIYDAVLDLREYSKTYKQWFSIELSEVNGLSLYIPPIVAHGFQTLKNNTSILYYMNKEYHHDCSKVINYKSCNIEWKEEPTVISEKDKNAPLLQ